MADDHQMRAECGIEFGAIKKELEFHKEWRDEQRSTLSNIQKEVEKLTGNGNRGRIDGISDQLSDIQRLLASHLSEANGRDARLDKHSKRLDTLESRLYKVAVGAAALAAILVPLAKMLLDKLI